LMDLVLTRRMADPQWGAKITGRAGGWNTGALVVRDEGGSLLLGSGYTPSSDSVLTRPGWYGLVRPPLPFGEGSNAGLLVRGHWRGGGVPAGPAGTAAEGGTFNGFGGLDPQLRLSAHWGTEGQVVGSGTRIGRGASAHPTQTFADWMGVWRLFYRDD